MNPSKIVRFHRSGGPEVLEIEEAPVEAPKGREVRLKVQAIGLNRADVLFRSGQYLEPPKFPSRIGVEAAGIVDALGPDVTQVCVGDRVSVVPGQSIGRYGTYGETAIVRNSRAVSTSCVLVGIHTSDILTLGRDWRR